MLWKNVQFSENIPENKILSYSYGQHCMGCLSGHNIHSLSGTAGMHLHGLFRSDFSVDDIVERKPKTCILNLLMFFMTTSDVSSVIHNVECNSSQHTIEKYIYGFICQREHYILTNTSIPQYIGQPISPENNVLSLTYQIDHAEMHYNGTISSSLNVSIVCENPRYKYRTFFASKISINYKLLFVRENTYFLDQPVRDCYIGWKPRYIFTVESVNVSSKIKYQWTSAIPAKNKIGYIVKETFPKYVSWSEASKACKNENMTLATSQSLDDNAHTVPSLIKDHLSLKVHIRKPFLTFMGLKRLVSIIGQ